MTIIDIILYLFLAVSIFTDIKYRKIFNSITFPVIILGLGMNFIYFGIAGLKDACLGLLAGFVFLFVFYIIGWMGAGDVKFMMAVGSLKGHNFVLMGGVYGAIIAGIAAIIILLFKKRFKLAIHRIFKGFVLFSVLKNKESLNFEDDKKINLPYTVFLSLGMIIYDLFSFRF